MVRSLWSAATGMNAQQTNVDTISNNLANVNTVGYKAQVNQFKSLLYQTLQTVTTTANGDPKPITSQVGLGVRNASINQLFSQGSLLASESDTAFAIEGDGFFAVEAAEDEVLYTRNGDFTWALQGESTPVEVPVYDGDGNLLRTDTVMMPNIMLTTTDGLPVLNEQGNRIVLSGGYMTSKITISASGEFYYPNEQNSPVPLLGENNVPIRLGTYQFNNPAGLERTGDTRWAVTAASGEPMNEATTPNIKRSKIVQGYLEGSNVQVADEMVNLIVAQRAYEMNSKAITTSDEMLQQANNLKR